MRMSEREMHIRVEEIKKLYEVTEAESVLIAQYITMFELVGHSRKLTLRLLKILVAMMEATDFDMTRNK